ncbi:tryptophan 7-halogenase [Exilibacterium tricleocarpae]|uniref:Tryptophan 7-halogenase n=1 Tax=Exilibacterium tricleocarpae TaxID=2591008 RepID=A0A545TLT0_9GAMM|nr:tryptophan halogenase family protein [Exilibacterium tricleocarpae]TQV78179.1 tryptophan 7-halogenase [Exilibacterium tricleocarpae]
MNTAKPVSSILIVGGGTAGWLTAAILAGKHPYSEGGGLQITLIEAPDIPIIGVGEGTWPGMRATLHTAGIKEVDFLKACDASFKQGSKFVGWKTGEAQDYYYHPFELPQGFFEGNLAQHWVDTQPSVSLSKLVCVQEYLCERDLSPKLRSSGNYSGVANYGYHLNAGKFSDFLKNHCTENLGVRLVYDKVTGVVSQSDGDIAGVCTEKSGELQADLFVDCTGFRSLLLGQHYGVRFIDKCAQFPINSALAVQVPYADHEPVKSTTIATAREAGWIWDIGLSSRRGVGYVYSNSHLPPEQAAAQLQAYLGIDNQAFEQLEPRRIPINPGHREKFWHHNCVAVGLAAGFLEPLEASAIMLIEASATMLADQMPTTRAAMDIVSKRFNKRFLYRWERVIDFLKLHYVLSDRQQPFWREAASRSTLSARLQEDLSLWRYQAPWKTDFDSLEEAFPAASYQYVLYGMQFETQSNPRRNSPSVSEFSRKAIDTVSRNAGLLASKVESNRALLDLIRAQ